VARSDVWPRVTHVLGIVVVNLLGASGKDTLLGIVVGLCGASGTLYWVLLLVYVPRATLYWVLLLVYVGPLATHFTGYYCWLCCALGNTLYWLLLLVYEGPQTTHCTGYCCGLCKVLGNTLYWSSLGLMCGAFISHVSGFKIILFKKIIVEKSKCRFPLHHIRNC
jgi:hypothetical protein